MKCGQKYSERIMGHLYFGGMAHLRAAFGDACTGKAELGSCFFGVGMVCWMGSYSCPPVGETLFFEETGSLVRQKKVLQHQEVRFVPMIWLLLCPIPAHNRPKSQSRRDANSVLWMALVRGQILSCMLQVLCEEIGVLQICLLRSSSHFPRIPWCFIGHVSERRKLLLNSKGGRSRKGM